MPLLHYQLTVFFLLLASPSSLQQWVCLLRLFSYQKFSLMASSPLQPLNNTSSPDLTLKLLFSSVTMVLLIVNGGI